MVKSGNLKFVSKESELVAVRSAANDKWHVVFVHHYVYNKNQASNAFFYPIKTLHVYM